MSVHGRYVKKNVLGTFINVEESKTIIFIFYCLFDCAFVIAILRIGLTDLYAILRLCHFKVHSSTNLLIAIILILYNYSFELAWLNF